MKAELNNVGAIDIEQVYIACKPKFIGMAKQLGANMQELIDVYQDAMVALIELQQKQKLNNIKVSIDTYLLAIAKYMLFKKMKLQPEILVYNIEDDLQVWEEYNVLEKEATIVALKNAFALLGEQCKKLLTLFYYEQKKLDNIVQIMNYENKDVAKSQKYKCIQHLKKFVHHGR